MEQEQKGIENLTKVIAVPVEMGNIIGEIMGEEKRTLKTYLKFIQVCDELVDLFKVEWKELGPEVKDLTDVEKAQIIEVMKEKFDIPQDKIEMIVEESLSDLVVLAVMINKWVSFAKSFKKS